MRILMITNVYKPFGGGVARSVSSCAEAFRERGHDVLVVAPEAEGQDESEPGVVRVPSIHRPLKRPFAIALPVPGLLTRRVREFEPTVVHSHHPFLLGDDALRIAASRGLPLVFTYHTQYGTYVRSLLEGGERLARFAEHLAVEYANLCQWVVAPSESIAERLRERGVRSPIAVVPTGVDVKRFSRGDGLAARERLVIPEDAFVVGHVGRLAEEKNLGSLGRGVARFLEEFETARFLVVGTGDAEEELTAPLEAMGVADRVHLAGRLVGQELADAYHALDVFAFASKSETQGLVLAEAMAAGRPVVALAAPGSSDILADGTNGVLVEDEDAEAFAEALAQVARMDAEAREELARAARETAEAYSLDASAERLLEVYEKARGAAPEPGEADSGRWHRLRRSLAAEWDLLTAGGEAASAAFGESD